MSEVHYKAVYEVRLMIEQPIEDEEFHTAYTSQHAKTDLEKTILKCLRRMDGDQDCEVMSVEIQEVD